MKTAKTQTIPAIQFKAELWTTVTEKEIWATVMLDGSDAGSPCAFGPKQRLMIQAGPWSRVGTI